LSITVHHKHMCFSVYLEWPTRDAKGEVPYGPVGPYKLAIISAKI